MLNGILLLSGRGKISSHDHVLLNALLDSLLVKKGVLYYTNEDLKKYEKVIKCLEIITNLKITHFRKTKGVKPAIGCCFDENKRVAICDVNNGEHSILIHGEITVNGERWLNCFDPLWENTHGNDNRQNGYRYCDENTTNIKIQEAHLLRANGDERGDERFIMGYSEHRFMTVLEA